MPTPAFPDCMNPASCECAARGYQHEGHTKCLLPSVEAAAAEVLGVNFQPFGKSRIKPSASKAVTRIGSVTLLHKTPDLAGDVLDAIDTAGGEPATGYSLDEMKRLIRQHQISSGLRAEAYGGMDNIVILHSHVERLATGCRVGCWLSLAPTPHGDAVSWNVSIMDGTFEGISFADRVHSEIFLALLRKAAGGPSTEQSDYRAEPPTDEELRELEKL